MTNRHTPYLVAIAEEVPSYPSGTHLSRIYGFGEISLEAAQREGARVCADFTARNGRVHHAEYSLACERCHCHGKEPGYKRKPCTKCGGKGTFPISTDPISEKIRTLFM